MPYRGSSFIGALIAAFVASAAARAQPEDAPAGELRTLKAGQSARRAATANKTGVVSDADKYPVSPPAGRRPQTRPVFETGLRLMTGFERFQERPDPAQGGSPKDGYGLFLHSVRLKLQATLNPMLSASVSADLSDALEPRFTPVDQRQPPYLRDAFMNVRFSRPLQVKVGRFKRPFSALEQRGPGKLQIRGRGLINNLVIEEKEWGDRALGAMFWGRLKKARLRYQLAVHDAVWRAGVRTQGFDLMSRVTYEPVSSVEIGVNGGRKQIETRPDTNESFYGAGGDITFTPGGLFLLLEGTYAELPFPPAGRDQLAAFGFLGLTSYDFEITPSFTLQPVLFLEYADADDVYTQNEAVRMVVGINLIFYGRLRVMPQVELIRPVGTVHSANPWVHTNTEYVMLSLEI